MQTIHTLPTLLETADASCFMAHVAHVQNGRVTEVQYNDDTLRIDECAVTHMAMAVGDKVLVQRVSGCLVVTQRFFSANEPQPPTLHFDGKQWCLSTETTLSLAIGAANLTLTPEGDIHLQGVDISTEAHRTNRLLGARIELN